MNKIKINNKILKIYSIIYLFSILITYSFLVKTIKPVYELSFSISPKNAYEIELLIGNEYRQKKTDFLLELINKYQNPNQNFYLNDYFSSRMLQDYKAGAIADTSFKFASNSISNVEKFRMILEKCDLPNNIKKKIINNLFANNMFNFKNYMRTQLNSGEVAEETIQYIFMFKGMSEKELQQFIYQFKKTLEEETLIYAKKLFLVNISIQYLRDEINKQITEIKKDEKVFNFFIDRIAVRSLNKNLVIFISLLLPIMVIFSIELLRLLVLNRIKIKLS
jgi:hypothetical protein